MAREGCPRAVPGRNFQKRAGQRAPAASTGNPRAARGTKHEVKIAYMTLRFIRLPALHIFGFSSTVIIGTPDTLKLLNGHFVQNNLWQQCTGFPQAARGRPLDQVFLTGTGGQAKLNILRAGPGRKMAHGPHLCSVETSAH